MSNKQTSMWVPPPEVREALNSAANENPPRGPKGTPTNTNLFAMYDALSKGGGSISPKVESADFPHLRRCLAAGLLESKKREDGRIHPTEAGWDAMAKYAAERNLPPLRSHPIERGVEFGGPSRNPAPMPNPPWEAEGWYRLGAALKDVVDLHSTSSERWYTGRDAVEALWGAGWTAFDEYETEYDGPIEARLSWPDDDAPAAWLYVRAKPGITLVFEPKDEDPDETATVRWDERGKPSRINPADSDPAPMPNPSTAKGMTKLFDSIDPQLRSFTSKNKLPMPIKGKMFGCGGWGCVVPSEDKNIVIKFTVDPDEILIVDKLIGMGKSAPEGFVKYYAVLKTKAGVLAPDRTGGVKPAVIFWREEASKVGKYNTNDSAPLWAYFHWSMACKKIFWYENEAATNVDLINKARSLLNAVGVSFVDSTKLPGRSPLSLRLGKQKLTVKDLARKLAKRDSELAKSLAFLVYWIGALHYANEMVDTDLDLVGRAIIGFAEAHGILLADVRDANLGVCMRGGEATWVITDPGSSISSGRPRKFKVNPTEPSSGPRHPHCPALRAGGGHGFGTVSDEDPGENPAGDLDDVSSRILDYMRSEDERFGAVGDHRASAIVHHTRIRLPVVQRALDRLVESGVIEREVREGYAAIDSVHAIQGSSRKTRVAWYRRAISPRDYEENPPRRNVRDMPDAVVAEPATIKRGMTGPYASHPTRSDPYDRTSARLVNLPRSDISGWKIVTAFQKYINSERSFGVFVKDNSGNVYHLLDANNPWLKSFKATIADEVTRDPNATDGWVSNDRMSDRFALRAKQLDMINSLVLRLRKEKLVHEKYPDSERPNVQIFKAGFVYPQLDGTWIAWVDSMRVDPLPPNVPMSVDDLIRLAKRAREYDAEHDALLDRPGTKSGAALDSYISEIRKRYPDLYFYRKNPVAPASESSEPSFVDRSGRMSVVDVDMPEAEEAWEEESEPHKNPAPPSSGYGPNPKDDPTKAKIRKPSDLKALGQKSYMGYRIETITKVHEYDGSDGLLAVVYRVDKNGRPVKSYKYTEEHIEKQRQAKFARAVLFAAELPKLRKRVDADMKSANRKTSDVATVIHLIDATAMRLGGSSEEERTGSRGAVTLQRKHVSRRPDGKTLQIIFPGKSGQQWDRVVVDTALVKALLRRMNEHDDPEDQLFDISPDTVQRYMRKAIPAGAVHFTPKDLRTYHATSTVAFELDRAPSPTDLKQAKANIKQAIKVAAEKLGNTEAVCKSSYVDPRLGESHIESVAEPSKKKNPSGESTPEQVYLAWLKQETKASPPETKLAATLNEDAAHDEDA